MEPRLAGLTKQGIAELTLQPAQSWFRFGLKLSGLNTPHRDLGGKSGGAKAGLHRPACPCTADPSTPEPRTGTCISLNRPWIVAVSSPLGPMQHRKPDLHIQRFPSGARLEAIPVAAPEIGSRGPARPGPALTSGKGGATNGPRCRCNKLHLNSRAALGPLRRAPDHGDRRRIDTACSR